MADIQCGEYCRALWYFKLIMLRVFACNNWWRGRKTRAQALFCMGNIIRHIDKQDRIKIVLNLGVFRLF